MLRNTLLVISIIVAFHGNFLAQDTCAMLPAPVEIVDFESTYCISEPNDTLRANTSGGAFSGPGISNDSIFNPSSAGAGTHTIYYSYLGYGIDTSLAYSPLPDTGTGVTLFDDDVAGPLNIGFTFNFFGNDYTNFYISSNGFITFNSGFDDGCCSGQFLLDNFSPNNLIAFAWDDLYPDGNGTIKYYTVGSFPNRKLVMTFTGIPWCCDNIARVTTQVILYETTNIIEIHTTSTDGFNNGMTMAIENIDGSVAHVVPGRNSDFWAATNEMIRFTPNVCSYLDSVEITVDNSPAIITLSDICFDFDTVFTSSVSQDTFTIYNTGCQSLTISNITNTFSSYTATPSSGNVLPGDSIKIAIEFEPITPGQYPDTFVITTNIGDTTVCVNGVALQAPQLVYAPDSFDITINGCCDSITDSLKIYNTGGNDLDWTVNSTILIGDDFDPNIDNNIWSVNTGIPNSSCSFIGNSCYFTNNGIREAQTVDLNTLQGGTISFYLLCSSGFPCGNSTESAEDVILEYSNNGGSSWNTITIYQEHLFSSFTLVSEVIPLAAQTSSTRFRWRQLTHTGSGFDNWAIDEMTISIANPNISVSPTIGTTLPGDSATVYFSFTSCSSVAGTYNEQLILTSNDPLNQLDTIPVKLTIVGSPEISFSDSCLNFDTVFTSSLNVDTLQIYNTGCDTLKISNITTSLSEYSIDTNQLTILPGDTGYLQVTFSPLTAGSYPDSLVIINDAVDTTVCLNGYAILAPAFSHNPDSFDITIVGCCDTIYDTLTVYNAGGNDLEWEFLNSNTQNNAIFYDGFESGNYTTNWSTGSCGFTYDVNTNAPAKGAYNLEIDGGCNNHYQGLEANFSAGTATNISWWVKSNSSSLHDGYFIVGQSPASTLNNRLEFVYMQNSGVINFQGAGVTHPYIAGQWYHIEFRNIDFVNDLYDLYIDDVLIQANSSFQGGSVDSVNVIELYNFNNSTAWYDDIYIGNGQLQADWITVNPDSGSTAPGDSTKIAVGFSSCDLTAGDYQGNIIINTNDPLSPSDTIPVDLTVIGDPEIALSDTCFDFDTIMEYTSSTQELWITNTGCDTMLITNISGSLSEFTYDSTNYSIPPGDSSLLEITFTPTSTGLFQDIATIFNNAGDTTICLEGFATPRPIVCHSPDSFNVIVNCGDSITQTLKICNSGIGDLEYCLGGNYTKILTLIEGVDTAAYWYDNLWTAINSHYTQYYLTEANPVDSNELKTLIEGKDVLLIPYRSFGNDLIFNEYGPIMQRFAEQGGTVIWLGQISSRTDAIDNSGVFDVTYVANAFNSCTILDSSYCITDSVNNPFSEFSTNYVYNVTNNDAVIIAEDGGGRDFVVLREIGAGRAILAGFPFFNYSDDQARIVSNSISCYRKKGTESWVILSQTEDTVITNDTSYIDVTFHSDTLAAGTYSSHLFIYSNDPLTPTDTIPITMTIVGAGAIALSDTCLYLDSIMEYTTTANTFKIYNTGCDTLHVTSFSTTLTEYSTFPPSVDIPVNDSATIGVIFSPTSVGTFPDTLTISTGVGDTSICLFGESYPRPVISLNPDSLCDTLLACCDSSTINYTVYNTGGSDLYFNSQVCDLNAIASLDSVLANLNTYHDSIENVIPSKYSFSEGISGTNISDGGGDMYDGGNFLGTDLGGPIFYSNNSISSSTLLGPTGKYFTRKYDGLWIFAADIDSIDFFEITGNLGADGSGFADGSVLNHSICNETYLAFVKRVSSSFDPSVNHMIVIPYDGALSHNFDTDTDNDQHQVTGLLGSTRIYYLLYAGATSNYISDPEAQVILQRFLETIHNTYSNDWINITSTNPDTIVPGDSAQVSVELNSCNLNEGTHNAEIIVGSNDPLNDPLTVSVKLVVDPPPAAPVANDTAICFGNPSPAIVASAILDSVRWYDDGNLTNLIHKGDTLYPPDTAVGVYTYYLTQSDSSGCEGYPDTITFTINPGAIQPNVSDLEFCESDSIEPFIAIGGNYVQWYDDALLTNLIHVGDTFFHGQTTAGTYTYYATDSIAGCPEGPADTITLNIHPIPASPTLSNDTTICFGDVVPQLSAAGCDSTNWYDDPALSNLVHQGNNFTPSISSAGVYTYYAVCVDTTAPYFFCESNPDSVTITINETLVPTANDTAICFGQTVPDLTAAGTSIRWYDDVGLTNLVFSGSPFPTGQTAVGSYTYYATQTLNGCESPGTPVTLTINPIPAAPVANDTSICFGDAVPDLLASGAGTMNWYDDANLTNLVFTGNPFPTGQTAVGIYTFYVTQTVAGCSGPSDTVTLTINPIPATPVALDTTICFGQTTPDLTATGNNVHWYDDPGLTNLVNLGNTFNTGETAVGIYTYYVRDSVAACFSGVDTSILSINPAPVQPNGSDTASCFGNPSPDLTANGTNIQWYDDGSLTNLVATGSPFPTGETAVGTYTYYVTDSLAGCPEGPADTVTLTIHPLPGAPVANDTTVCFGNPVPDLIAIGGDSIRWYDNAILTNLVFVGDTFITGETAPGTYTYYLTETDSATGCQSLADTVTLTIFQTLAPSANDTFACFGNSIPDLIAFGDSIRWYDNSTLTNLVFTGDTFATGQTAVGIYTYYATQTDSATGCESASDTVTLSINPTPSVPVAADATVCFGEPVPDLTASGTNPKWYDDGNLTNLVFTGSPFSTGQTVAGTYTYYVTDSVAGCESGADTVTLTIQALPGQPNGKDTTICFGQITPDLIANGSNIKWYDDGSLTNLVHTGDTFATGETAIGVYTYYVTDSMNGCSSIPDTVTLTISPAPSVPVVNDTSACFGDSIPDLIASGTTIQWYDDGSLTNLVHVGDTFATGQTAVGTYTYYVTDSLSGCPESGADTVTLTIIALPPIPTGTDTSVCFGDPTPDLSATGTNVEWYNDINLTNLVNTGNTFSTGETVPGTYTYYVTDSLNGCPSIPDTVTLTIFALPAAPVANDTVACFGNPIPDLIATVLGDSSHWYDNPTLTNLVHVGDTFATGQTAVGTYTYYVTQFNNGCEGISDTVTLTINPTPAVPLANDTSACFGDAVPDLTATGSNLMWYDDGNLTNLVFTGSSFATGQTAIGTYTYYVIDSLNGCVSTSDTVTLNIISLPGAPTAADQQACFGDSIPDLISTSSGDSTHWYDDGNLTNLVHTGDTFATGQTAIGTYTYYVTQYSNGCEGISDTVTLTIGNTPNTPSVNDTSVCFGYSVPDLIASGTNIQWYDDGNLTNLVHVGDTFVTGQTNVGSYTYYLRDSLGGCISSVDTVTLTILSTPAAPVVNDTTVCFGDVVPDLIASGSNIQWYDDGNLTNLVFSGDTFVTGQNSVGSYTYYVTDSIGECVSISDTVTLTITNVPSAPIVNDTAVCFGDSVPDLIASGTNIQWYDDGNLTNLVHTGDTFATGQTGVGSYTYYVRDSLGGCISGVDTVTLTILLTPTVPVVNDTAVCFGDSVPDLIASGSNIRWYDDGNLTNLVHTGDTFATGQTAIGAYTYYVTDSTGGCVSISDTVTLTINALPAKPVVNDTTVCFGDSVPDLVTSGGNIRWYDDGNLTNLVHAGDTFATGETAVGSYTYYVVDSTGGCISNPDTVTLTILTTPAAPVVTDTAVCFGDSVPDLIASGSNIQWYDDGNLTNLVHTGDTFATGQTVVGSYTYYLTDSAGSCVSNPDTVTLTIVPLPATPNVNDTTVCFGDSVPDLIASGSNIQWYDDTLLSNLVFAGDTFATGETAVGSYTYYVTDSTNGCISNSDTVTLTILPTPSAPVANDTAVCFGDSVPDLITSGSNIKWYDDGNLTNLVHTGDTFATGQTAVGTYTYYLTDSTGGCTSIPDTVTLIIDNLPAQPVANDTTVCFGDSVPDLISFSTEDSTHWYTDTNLTNLVYTGDTFATGQTSVGTYTYYVTQFSNGCEGLADTVTLTISPVPTAPVANDTAVCFDDVVPDLITSGSNIKWYDDGNLTNLVHSGDTFATGETAIGTYTYYLTDSSGGCVSEPDTVTLSILSLPAAPVANDTAVCFGEPVPELITSGTYIKWYDDVNLTNLVHVGDTFATGQTATGSYTYYVTDSVGPCESLPDTVTLTINPVPATPSVSDTAVCLGDSVPDLIASGSNIRWYDDGNLTNLVHVGDTLATGQTNIGTYTYYVTDSAGGCTSGTDTVTLSILNVPAAPIANDTSACFGDPIPDLTTSGTHIKWYDDVNLTNLVHVGDTFATGETNIGTYTYYVTDNVGACESQPDTVTLTINALPAPPVGNDTSECFGNPTPDLVATGTNIQWYDDANLTNLVFTGNPFATGETAIGVYTYYATQTVNGCESPPDTIVLTITSGPSVPVALDTTVCHNDNIPPLTATGTNVRWYDDPQLLSLVGTGNTFNHGKTSVGTYNYYVTQTTGCQSVADTATLVINPNPLVTLNTYSTGIFPGDSVELITYNTATYSWSPTTGLNIATGDTVMASPAVTTVYTVTGTNAVGCTNTASVTVTVFPVGIAENIGSLSDFIVFPNPARETVMVSFTAPGENESTIRLMNSIGQVVEQQTLYSHNGKYLASFEVKQLANGIYHLEVITTTGTATQKIVVN